MYSFIVSVFIFPKQIKIEAQTDYVVDIQLLVLFISTLFQFMKLLINYLRCIKGALQN